MAAGDTDVTTNKALLFLRRNNNPFADGTPQASISKQLYKEVKLSTLGMYRWSFTIAKQQLARDTVTPNSEWTYQYLLPNDMVTGVPEAVRLQLLQEEPTTKLGNKSELNWWISVLMTESTEIHIDYQKIISEGSMPTYFVTLLAYQLAWHMAEAITDQTTKAEYWRTLH